MNVADAVDLLDSRTLETALHFWNAGRSDWPESDPERRSRLKAFMVDKAIVEDRFGRLPPILSELLTYVIRGTPWERPFDLREIEFEHLSLDEPSVHAAGAALAERGFFAIGRLRHAGHHRVLSYQVPDEIGAVLSTILDSQRRPFEASLCLRSYLRFDGRGSGTDVAVAGEHPYEKPEAVLLRRAAAAESWIDEMWPSLIEHGGVLDADARERLEIECDRTEWERRGQLLERHDLGTFETRSLTNHGLRIGDGWLVIFGEIAEEELRAIAPPGDEAEAEMQRAPDFLADVAGLVRDIELTPLKRKKSGEIMKNSIKRLSSHVLSPGRRGADPDDDILLILEFLETADLLKFGTDGQARPTPKWRPWEKKGPVARLKDALNFAVHVKSPEMSPFHAQSLRRGLLRELKTLGTDRWVDVSHVAILARNRYLREAVRGEHARQYQEFHKQAPFPRLVAPGMMLRSLAHWTVDHLVRLGMLDVAVREGAARPWAVRLTPLAAAVLGLRPESSVEGESGLFVNPDHEIVVFPESATYDLLQKVSRFATRVKADFSVHYRLTRESVQSGVAGGMNPDAILKLLTENSRYPVPQNVEYSIREWAKSVQRITTRRAFLLETSTRHAADAVAAIPELGPVIARRLSPTIIELNEDPTQAGIVKVLRDHGIYL